jgi:hypothetical protein
MGEGFLVFALPKQLGYKSEEDDSRPRIRIFLKN